MTLVLNLSPHSELPYLLLPAVSESLEQGLTPSQLRLLAISLKCGLERVTEVPSVEAVLPDVGN